LKEKTMTLCRSIHLAKRPAGLPADDTWELREGPVPTPGEGDVLVKVAYISLDPAMRGWINEGRSYIDPVNIGDMMRAGGIGEVIESRDPKFKAGDTVVGTGVVATHAVARARDLTKVDPSLAPLPRFLGGLGMPGMTAYFGLLDVGVYKPGDVVVVSGASGAVGALVGQIAKLKGSKVIGIAGGKEKCDYCVQELGFDACIDYKSENVLKKLREHCPEGLDIYFDNVGGEILEACLASLKKGARIVICGAISQYNNMQAMAGPRNYIQLLINRARMEGFVVFDYASRYAEAQKEIAGWMASGQVKFREDIREGIETFPQTLRMLFTGENFGKLVLKL
jgi:NADPH-dependent curcumin reductase